MGSNDNKCMNRSDMNGFWVDPSLASVAFLSEGVASHFFGYYGISPWSLDNARLLAHSTRASSPFIPEGESVGLGWFDLDTGGFNQFEETHACNWQQGSLLRWMPGSNDTVIFNTRVDGRAFARICEISTGKKHDLPRPVHAVAPNGHFGLSVNVERLYYTRRAYSYEHSYDTLWSKSVVEGDGVFRIDFGTGDAQLVVSTAELAQREPTPTMHGARHWVDHPMIAPDNGTFLFYHRWMTGDGSFFSRLYTLNTDGTGLKRYADGGMYSHATWLDSDEFVVFARPVGRDARSAGGRHGLKQRLLALALPAYRKTRRFPVIRGLRRRILKDRYFVFSVTGGEEGDVLSDQLLEDGHPSFNPKDPALFLTDTYPDSKGRQHLLLLNRRTGDLKRIAWFQAPKGVDSTTADRCDLHPRWDRSGTSICVDVMLKRGKRQVCVLELN